MNWNSNIWSFKKHIRQLLCVDCVPLVKLIIYYIATTVSCQRRSYFVSSSSSSSLELLSRNHNKNCSASVCTKPNHEISFTGMPPNKTFNSLWTKSAPLVLLEPTSYSTKYCRNGVANPKLGLASSKSNCAHIWLVRPTHKNYALEDIYIPLIIWSDYFSVRWKSSRVVLP